MKKLPEVWRRIEVCLVLLIPLASIISLPVQSFADLSSNASVFATGLDNPRGLKFGPDGNLYVAEAGSGGSTSTVTICPELQIGPPFGPYTNGRTARISRIDSQGNRITVLDGLPSGQSQAPDWQGIADIAFIGDRLFALIQGGGCSYGEATIPKSIVEVNQQSHSFQVIADLGAFRRANPPSLNDDDLEPEGVNYSMTVQHGNFYVLDANSSALLKVSLAGKIQRLVDFSATLGQHVTPVAMEWHGVLYVGNLFEFPIIDGASSIFQITPSGRVRTKFTGLTAIVGIAFDQQKRFYVLEMGNGQGSGFPDPEAGRIVRILPSGKRDIIATGFTFPTAMTLGHDGRLYVSNRGFDIPPVGTGEILAVEIPD